MSGSADPPKGPGGSPFTQGRSPSELEHDGVAGACRVEQTSGDIRCVPMRVWVQELTLRESLGWRWLGKDRSPLSVRAGEGVV